MRSLYHERQAPSEAPIRRFGGVVEVGAEVGGRLRHRDAENAAGTVPCKKTDVAEPHSDSACGRHGISDTM